MKHTILGLGCLLLMGLSWQVGAYDEDDLKKLKVDGECRSCDLSGSNLSGANLSGFTVEESDLTTDRYCTVIRQIFTKRFES